jgi:hypothetical protein
MSAGAGSATFRERFRIRASEMGPDARLRLPALFDFFQELPAPENGVLGTPFRVTRYDLDLNGRANNVAILRALLTALPAAAAPPLAFEADFRGEAFEGDVLLARVEEGSDATRVLLSRERDGKEVARAVIEAGRGLS